MSLILNQLKVVNSLIVPGTITTGGNVGINTTTPQTKLDVFVGANNTFAASFGHNVGAGSFAGFSFGYQEQGNLNYRKSAWVFERTDGHSQGANASGKIHLLLRNDGVSSAISLTDSVMTIDSDASGTRSSVRVGIGTTSPNAKLHVNGGMAFGYGSDAAFYTGTEFDSSKYLFLQNNTDSYGRIGLAINAKTFNGANTPSSNDGWAIDSPRSGIRFRAWLTGDTDYQTKFTIQHLLANSQNANGDLGIFARGFSTTNPAFVLTGAGNIGIGTTSPSTPLHIYKTGLADNSTNALLTIDGKFVSAGVDTNDIVGIAFRVENSGGGSQTTTSIGSSYQGSYNGLLLQPSGGNVGIGVKDPLAKLHILSSTPTSVTSVFTNSDIIIDSNTNSYINFRQTADTGAYGGFVWTDNNHGAYIVFRNWQGSAATGGDSLIYGTYQDHIFQAGSSATINGRSEVMRITNAGNVGIGQTAPGYKLDVTGAARITSAIYSPIFYDSADSGYYCDPNGASNFYDLNFGGKLAFRQLSTNTVYGPNIHWGITQPNGIKLYYDEEFEYGSNSIQVYNNNGGTAVTITRKNSSFLDGHTQVPNSTGYVLEIKHDPATSSGTSPYNGGWYFATNTGAGKAFLCVFKMKIPSGRNISFHSNSTGTNSAVSWITNVAGTGQYEDYAIIVNSGTASWSSTFFFAVDGAATLFYTYLASATVYELTNVNDKNVGGSLGVGVNSQFTNCRFSLAAGNTARFGISDGTVTSNMWTTSSTFHISTETNHPMVFITNANERLRIAADGNVGIGTTSPGAKLEVNGGIRLQNNYNLYWGASTGDQSAGANTPIITATQGFGFYIVPNGTTSGTTFRIAANGDVGISTGTGAPSYKLHVAGDIYANGGWFRVSGNNGIYWETHGGGWYMNDGTYIRSYNNKVVMGYNTGGGSGTATAFWATSGNNANYFGNNQLVLSYGQDVTYAHAIKSRHDAGNVAGNAIDFYTWKYGTDSSTTIGTQHVMSLNGPNVGIGQTAPAYKLDVTGSVRITGALSVGNTTPSATAGEIRATDNITAYYSDERLKTKLGLIEDAIEKVKKLSGFYFEANEEAVKLGYKKKREVGVSAQEVNSVLPEIIAPAPIDDKYMTVRYEKLIPLLIEAIKDQQKQIESLSEELKLLKNKL